MIRLVDAPLFRGMEPEVAEAIARVFLRTRVEAGETVFHEGDEGKALVVIIDGTFELVRASAEGEIHLADVQPGRVLGLTSLVDPGPRTATLRALEEGELAVLDRPTFTKLWDAQGDTAARLHYQLALVAIEELRSANRKLVDLLATPLEGVPPTIRRRVYEAGFFD